HSVARCIADDPSSHKTNWPPLIPLASRPDLRTIVGSPAFPQSAESDPVYQSLREHPNSVIVYTGPDVHEVEGAFLAVGAHH
ncbi:MAG: hypothetical protein AAF488_06885, partial [Planctomycetota bacterium]